MKKTNRPHPQQPSQKPPQNHPPKKTGPKPKTHGPHPLHPLLASLPEDLPLKRLVLFVLLKPIILSPAEYAAIWPHAVRNWTMRNSETLKSGLAVATRFHCPLSHGAEGIPNESKSTGKRKRSRRPGLGCGAILTITEYRNYADGPVVQVIFKRGRGESAHNHGLDALDRHRRPMYVLQVAEAMMREMRSDTATVYWRLRGKGCVDEDGQPSGAAERKLWDAGGGSLKLGDVHNAGHAKENARRKRARIASGLDGGGMDGDERDEGGLNGNGTRGGEAAGMGALVE